MHAIIGIALTGRRQDRSECTLAALGYHDTVDARQLSRYAGDHRELESSGARRRLDTHALAQLDLVRNHHEPPLLAWRSVDVIPLRAQANAHEPAFFSVLNQGGDRSGIESVAIGHDDAIGSVEIELAGPHRHDRIVPLDEAKPPAVSSQKAERLFECSQNRRSVPDRFFVHRHEKIKRAGPSQRRTLDA